MGVRRLTDIQMSMKENIQKMAISATRKDKDLQDLYKDPDLWRLAKLDANVTNNGKQIFAAGDYTIARKEENIGAAMPHILAFSVANMKHVQLKATDPVEFMED